MPRNIDALLDQFLFDGDLPQFVLCFAINKGVEVPNHVLKRFGPGYGPDTFLTGEHSLKCIGDEIAKLLEQIRLVQYGSPETVDNILEVDFKSSLAKYQSNLERFNRYFLPMQKMKHKIAQLHAHNDFQAGLRSDIIEFLDQKEMELKNEWDIHLNPPVKKSKEGYLSLLKDHLKIKWQDRRRTWRHLHLDPLLSEQLALQWFNIST